jgi:photosystem II stability/assembly factor-like uncharacterized protein
MDQPTAAIHGMLRHSFYRDINEVVAITPNLAVAGCDDGNVIRTTNGGATWELIATGITGTNSDILAIDFADENIGLVAAYNGTVARTTDGGATWNIISTIVGTSPWDMHMVDSLYAWVSGTGERIFRTTDGGLTWTSNLPLADSVLTEFLSLTETLVLPAEQVETLTIQ